MDANKLRVNNVRVTQAMYVFTCPVCYTKVEGEEEKRVRAGAHQHALQHEPAINARDLALQNTERTGL